MPSPGTEHFVQQASTHALDLCMGEECVARAPRLDVYTSPDGSRLLVGNSGGIHTAPSGRQRMLDRSEIEKVLQAAPQPGF